MSPAARLQAFFFTRVPVNFSTVAYAYFMGSLLSLPIALFLNGTGLRPFDPPDWVAPYYWISFLSSLVLLPCWCSMTLHDLRILYRMGYGLFLTYLVIVFIGLFFPVT